MLFTDSDIITAADLLAVDGEAQRVASSEQPPLALEGAGSIIRNAVEEAGQEIRARFQNFSGYLVSPGINVNHVAAVLNILSTAINRPRMRLNQVVAWDPDPAKGLFKNWLRYRALFQLYRNAFSRFLKNTDRYERKMLLYEDQAKTQWSRLTADGIPVVLIPLPCPGAVRELGAGTFGTSNVTVGGSGSTEPGASYVVAITWVVQPAYVSASNKGNAESAGSAQIAAAPTIGQRITVNTIGLNSPSSTLPAVGTADGLYTQMAATHWNVYVGASTAGSPLYLQNGTPLPLSTTSYTLTDKPVLSGAVLTPGQFADYNFAFQNMLHRA